MRLSTCRIALGLFLGALIGVGVFGVAPTAVFVVGAVLAVALQAAKTHRAAGPDRSGSWVGSDGRLVLSQDG